MISHVTNDELIAAFGIVGSFAEVGRLFGLSRQAVQQRLAPLGFTSDMHGRPYVLPICKNCEHCGADFYPLEKQTRHCSRKCAGAARKKYTPEMLRAILDAHGGHLAHASNASGITAPTFYRYLGKGIGKGCRYPKAVEA